MTQEELVKEFREEFENFVYEQYWSAVEKYPNSFKADIVIRTIARNCTEEATKIYELAEQRGYEKGKAKVVEKINKRIHEIIGGIDWANDWGTGINKIVKITKNL